MRLLTWNVQWCRGLDGVVDPARIAREARRLADPDVLCLQEISVGFISLPGSHGENQVDALRAALPGYQLFYAAAVDVKRDKGHLILFAFQPQWRGQPTGTFRTVFNAAFFAREVSDQVKGSPGFWTDPGTIKSGTDETTRNHETATHRQ